jgi:hypothetical protein
MNNDGPMSDRGPGAGPERALPAVLAVDDGALVARAVAGDVHVHPNDAGRCRVVRAGGGHAALGVVEEWDGRGEQQVDQACEGNGPGICCEVIGQVSKRFFTTKAPGSGTGPATSPRTVEAHGGNLFVASEPGPTVFTVTMPAAS